MTQLPSPEACAARIVELCLEAARPYEFATFLVGVRAQRAQKSLPEAALAEWKSLVKRKAGLELYFAWEELGRLAAFRCPELLFVYDVDRDALELSVRPVHVYGRYRKLVRDLPQTEARWRCPACRDLPEDAQAACGTCGGSGLQYPVALEDLIGQPAAVAFAGEGYQLHGLGREDVDVRCLGSGRPFVLEVKVPRRRTVDLDALARAVEAGARGQVELPAGLHAVPAEVVPQVKSHSAPKVYRALVAAEADLDPARVAALEGQLTGQVLSQRTPARVARRRADKVRRRRVLGLRASAPAGVRFELEVEAESGTYIKELISGDDGRTTPSVAGLLGVPCRCAELDVLDVRVADAALRGPDGAG